MDRFDTSRFAVIADTHGNADALAAVLHDIDAQGIGPILNLGDHLSGPLAPLETARLLMARDMICIRGNHDRWLLETPPDEMSPVDRAAHDDIGAGERAWLAALPATWTCEDVFACHGTPGDDNTYWPEEVTPEGRVVPRAPAAMAREAEGIAASLFLCGHTHMPRRVDLGPGAVLLNPGSVGCPAYRDDAPVPHAVETGTGAACYALVERTGPGWRTELRHVPYDPSRMIERARALDHAHWAPRLTSGRVA